MAARVGPGEGRLDIPCPDIHRAEVEVQLRAGPGTGEFQLTGALAFADPADEDGRLAILERGANHVELEVGPTDGWRILMFTDAHYPGWRATVDGDSVPIRLANDAFKAVAVPPGTHRVRFEFAPPRVRLGIGLSIAGIALAALVLRPGRRHASRARAAAIGDPA